MEVIHNKKYVKIYIIINTNIFIITIYYSSINIRILKQQLNPIPIPKINFTH
jgi:hypothetical protein